MNSDRDITSPRLSNCQGGSVNYCEKLNTAYEKLKLKLGALTAYTIFKLAAGKVPSEISGKLMLSEKELLADFNEKDFQAFFEAVKNVLLASFGESVAEILLEDLWE